jgi:hypothetical protein
MDLDPTCRLCSPMLWHLGLVRSRFRCVLLAATRSFSLGGSALPDGSKPTLFSTGTTMVNSQRRKDQGTRGRCPDLSCFISRAINRKKKSGPETKSCAVFGLRPGPGDHVTCCHLFPPSLSAVVANLQATVPTQSGN